MWNSESPLTADSESTVTDSPTSDVFSSVSRSSPLFCFPSDDVIQKLQRLTIFPKCLVFDLDDTLWVGDIDCTYGPPFRPCYYPDSSYLGVDGIVDCNKMEDSKYGRKKTLKNHATLRLFSDVLAIFSWLEFKGVSQIAIASRTTQPSWAKTVLSLLRTTAGTPFSDLIDCCECRDVSKQVHLKSISKKLQVDLCDIVFYDNLYYNLTDALALPSSPNPVVIQYTPDGLDWDTFIKGLTSYQNVKIKNK